MLFDFNGVSIQVNDVYRVEKVSEWNGYSGHMSKTIYGIKIFFRSGGIRIVGYGTNLYQRDWDYNWCVRNL